MKLEALAPMRGTLNLGFRARAKTGRRRRGHKGHAWSSIGRMLAQALLRVRRQRGCGRCAAREDAC